VTDRVTADARRAAEASAVHQPVSGRHGLGVAGAATTAVAVAWTLLLISVQPWSATTTTGPQPSNLGKGIVVGIAVVIAIASAKGILRGRIPPMWWCYLVYAGVAVASSLLIGGVSSVTVRVVRLLAVLSVGLCLWPNIVAPRTRLITGMFIGYVILATTTILGPLVAPGRAWENGVPFTAGGRIIGPILPMLPTRIGEIGAIVVGLALIYWAFGELDRKWAAAIIVIGVALLVLSRTRTATVAVGGGLVLAALATRHSAGGRNLRKTLAWLALIAVPLIPVIVSWIQRGQSGQQISSLSGRTVVWHYILHLHVDLTTFLFGHGLGHTEVFIRRPDNTLNYAPIDGSWISLYYESGLVGVALVGAGFLMTALMSFRCRTPVVRACCILIMTYVSIDSFSESGLSDASSLLLLLMVASMSSYIDRPHSLGQLSTR
jgi:hypothetical protein